MAELKITAVWEGSLEKDLLSVMRTDIAPALYTAMERANDDAKAVLYSAINETVYGSYFMPTVYKRRSGDRSLGTPLNDIQRNMSDSSELDFSTLNGKMTIDYHPTGEHKVKKWSSTYSGASGYNNVDGDALIARIENKSPSYNWGNAYIPKRPFWRKFVDTMINGDGYNSEFRFYLKFPPESGIQFDIENGIQREDGDGEY